MEKIKYPEDYLNKIICADCMVAMKDIPDNSIDSLISDVPYGLSFLGKRWDYDVPSVEVFKEMLRVAKPGATALIFAGARTQHRIATNIEDAGWILKDCIMWIFGQGFPKSTDISKQIDKQSGMERKVVGIRKSDGWRSGKTSSVGQYLINYGPYIPITEPATPEAKLWNGWHSHGLKPAYEPIIVAMKPNDGSYAENALKWGVAGLNINGGKIGINQIKAHHAPKGTFAGGEERKSDTNYYNNLGRFPANLILDEEAAQELDKQSGISRSRANIKSDNRKNNGKSMFLDGIHNPENSYNDTGGASRFFKVIEDDYPRFIYCAKASGSERNRGCEELEDKPAGQSLKDDNYTRENMGNTPAVNREPTKNNHPTVKPLKLLEYLCILTKTPTGGIILDPFAGSGTTCMAAKKIGRTYIGIEQDEEYCKIARARIDAIEPEKNLF